MISIRKWVTARAREAAAAGHVAFAAADRLAAAFDDPAAAGLGLLLNERVINMPPELAPAIFESLSRDLEWAAANATPPETAAAFGGLRNLLLVSPCFSERASDGAIAAHAAAVADAGAIGAGRKAKGAKARKPRHAAVAAAAAASSAGPEPASSSASSSAHGGGGGGGGGGNSNSALDDPLGLGPGWLTHYLHFEEELLAAHAQQQQSTAAASSSSGGGGLSFAFKVKHFEKGDAPAPVSGDIGADAGAAAGGGRKQQRSGAGAAAASSSASQAVDDSQPRSHALRAPASRRISLLPAAALPVCLQAMQHLLVEASAGAGGAPAAAAAAAAAAAGGAAPAGPAGPARHGRPGAGAARK